MKSVFPAEWGEHAATLLAWPFEPSPDTSELWEDKLEHVRSEHLQLIIEIAEVEKVVVFLGSDEAKSSFLNSLAFVERSQLLEQSIRCLRASLDDIWLRDTAPLFVFRQGQLIGRKFQFNGWGNKFASKHDEALFHKQLPGFPSVERVDPYCVFEGGSIEVNGKGLGITTVSCLLSPERSPATGSNQQFYERLLQHELGISELCWLPDGLIGDHTDGHVDTIVRFVREDIVLCSLTDNQQNENYTRLQNNFRLLNAWAEGQRKRGVDLTIVPLVLPEHDWKRDGDSLALTYANFYLCNKKILVPQYGLATDAQALATISNFAGDRDVVGLSSKAIIFGGGSFHCLTQQIPLS